MALTIEQLQALIDAKPDLRELINQIADYLQANPGGGGSQDLDQVLATGSGITEDRVVNLGGFELSFQNGKLKLPPIPEFSDNATALTAGLLNGHIYFTVVDGEAFLKRVRD